MCVCVAREAEDEAEYYEMAHIFLFSCRSALHEVAEPRQGSG